MARSAHRSGQTSNSSTGGGEGTSGGGPQSFVPKRPSPDVPPSEGGPVPAFEALLCTGETFRFRRLTDPLDGGGVIVFSAFAFNAIAENWWKRYEYADWDTFDVPVVGASRDGPYPQNAFLWYLDSPFRMSPARRSRPLLLGCEDSGPLPDPSDRSLTRCTASRR